MSKKKNNFIVQGSILAVAGIIARLIGLARRIPMQHIIGNVGNGYYTIAYEIYNIMLMISCYSLPLAVSKVVSKKMNNKEYVNAHRTFKSALMFAIVAGCITFTIAEVFGDFLAGVVMKQPMSTMSVRVLGPALLFVSIMGVFRGYFQGHGTMVPTAVSQILEQVFVVGFSIVGAYFFYQKGSQIGTLLQNENWAAAYGAAGASLGPVAGSVVGLLFLLFIYFAYKPTIKKQMANDVSGKEDSAVSLLKLVIITAIPVLINTTIYNICPIIDQAIYNRVMIAKNVDEVLSAHNLGVYSGEYRVLVNVPIALASAMCSSIVPVLTGLIEKKDYATARARISQGIRFTMIITIPSAIGLGVLARPVLSLLFKDDIDLAVSLLQVGAVYVILASLSTLTSGILQGINRMKLPVINAVIALGIHILFLYVTLQMGLGIHAVLYSTIVFSLIVCILNWISIKKNFKYKQEVVKTFIYPLVCALIMGAVLLIINIIIGKYVGRIIIVLLSLVIGVIVYFGSLILLKGIDEDDLKKLPGGRTILTMAKKCRLL